MRIRRPLGRGRRSTDGRQPVRPSALWRRPSLWARVVVAVTVAFLVLFGVFGILALRAVDDSTRAIMKERLVLTEMAARQYDRLLDRTIWELRAAGSLEPRTGDHSPLERERRVVAAAWTGLPGLALRVWLLDAQGRPIAVEPRAPTPPPRFAAQRYVRGAIARARPGFSQPYRDATGKPAVAVAVPIRDGGGGLQGAVLVAVLDISAPEFVAPIVQAKRLGRTGHAWLIGQEGLAISATDPKDVLHLGEHLPFYRRMLASRGSGVETVPYRAWDTPASARPRWRHVMAWVPLRDAPWGVSVGGSKSETFAAADRLRGDLLLGGAGALAGLWLVALIGARLLVRPVYVLTRAARAMASGDLEQQVRVDEGGEIGVLGESLEAMRVQLRASLETIQRWGQSLETKVEERTQELRVRNRQLAAVTAVATAANQPHDLAGMIDACLAAILADTEMDGAAVRLADSQTGGLGAPFERGTHLGLSCHGRALAAGACACARAAAGEEPLYLSRDDTLGCLSGGTVEAVTVLPLATGERLLGVLTLVRERGGVPGSDERRTLVAIADQLAVGIENVQLVEEIGRVEAQRKLQRLRTELISMVSHELRTPLGFIKGYATTLLHDEASIDAGTRRQFLEIIDEETAKLERMIEELLDASRLQAERLPIELTRVDVATLVRNLALRTRPSLGDGQELAVRVPDGEVAVLADPLRLEQVIGNLLDNAAWYGSSELPIELDVIAEDGHALISVRDHGAGIPAAAHESIFEPFVRGGGVARRGAHGFGLGLAICKGLVEAHGGTIWVESVEGHGAAFVVSLPLLAPAADKAPPL